MPFFWLAFATSIGRQTSPAVQIFRRVILRSNSSPTPNSVTLFVGRGNNQVAASRVDITPAATPTTFPPSWPSTQLPTPSPLSPPDQQQPLAPVLAGAGTPERALRRGPGTDLGTGSMSAGRYASERSLAQGWGGGDDGDGSSRSTEVNTGSIGGGGGDGANLRAFTRNISPPLLGSFPFSFWNMVQIPSAADTTTTAALQPGAAATATATATATTHGLAASAAARNTRSGGQPPSAARGGVESVPSSKGVATGADDEGAGRAEGGGKAAPAAAPTSNRDRGASSRVISPPADGSGVGCSIAAADALGGANDVAPATVVCLSATSLSEVSATGTVVAVGGAGEGGGQGYAQVGRGGDDDYGGGGGGGGVDDNAADPRGSQDDPVRSSSSPRYPIGDVPLVVGSGGGLSCIMHHDDDEAERGDGALNNHRRPLRER